MSLTAMRANACLVQRHVQSSAKVMMSGQVCVSDTCAVHSHVFACCYVGMCNLIAEQSGKSARSMCCSSHQHLTFIFTGFPPSVLDMGMLWQQQQQQQVPDTGVDWLGTTHVSNVSFASLMQMAMRA
jgi:hypothetical protein